MMWDFLVIKSTQELLVGEFVDASFDLFAEHNYCEDNVYKFKGFCLCSLCYPRNRRKGVKDASVEDMRNV